MQPEFTMNVNLFNRLFCASFDIGAVFIAKMPSPGGVRCIFVHSPFTGRGTWIDFNRLRGIPHRLVDAYFDVINNNAHFSFCLVREKGNLL